MISFNPDDFLILVVDDVSSNLQVLIAILEKAGYPTTFANNGEQALNRIKNVMPDLILLDLMMPVMDGIQVCEHLKAEPLYREIPIIFLTASHEQDHLIQAFDSGAVDYVTKPYKAGELLARIKVHLELKSTKEQLQKALEAQEKLSKELEKLATTDSLTGIYNRRQLMFLAEKEFNLASRYERHFSLLILDIDRFKKINDTYGHPVGDEAIKAVSKATANCLRSTDYFGRFGGEEFVVILPETDSNKARQLAERIRLTIAELTFSVQQESLKITISIGVASYQAEDTSINAILKRADDALYQAKNGGRDRVVFI